MKWWITAAIILGSVLVPQVASAQSPFERITRFDSNVYVSSDNKVHITETIRYDFSTLQRHGIYRDVPIDYDTPTGETYKLAFEYEGTVDENGRKVTAETSRMDGNYRIRLGDPDAYVTGQKTYRISYTLRPIVTQKKNQPYVALDVTGNGWQVPIDEVHATLRFDDDAKLTNPTCYTGSFGSREQNCSFVSSEAGLIATAEGLSAGQGLSVEGELPKGYVSSYLEPGAARPLTKEDIMSFVVFGAIVTAIALVILVYMVRWWRAKRRRANQTVIPEYEPPVGLTPAEIGYLQDDISTVREITATLIDLAVHGYIRIEQTEGKKLLKKAQYTLHKLKDVPANHQASALVSAIFSDGASAVAVSKLNKSAMASAVLNFHTSLKASLKNKGYYATFKSEPNLIEKLLDAGKINEAGAKIWAQVAGFKLYIETVEKDRLKFTDAPEKTPALFNKYLPYAVALGVEKEWAKQFEGIDVGTATTWYTGTHPGLFTAGALASDLGSSFAPVVSSNSSVSSSGGGGSSGGGFGGGGGGSW